MSFKNVDHVAIAVQDLDKAVGFYTSIFGKSPEHIEEVDEQKVRAAFFAVGKADDPMATNLELLEPTSPESPIAKFLEKNPRGGLHHICVEVKDIEAHLASLKEQGIILIDEKPKKGAHGKRIAFVHPKSTGGVLLELSEPEA